MTRLESFHNKPSTTCNRMMNYYVNKWNSSCDLLISIK